MKIAFIAVLYDKHDGFGTPPPPWLSGDITRRPLYDIYIAQLVLYVKSYASVLNFYSRDLHITSKLMPQGCIYHKIRNRLESGLKAYTELLSNGAISQLVFYGDLVYKLRRAKGTANFIPFYRVLK